MDKPSFFSVTPATVRYDNSLCANAKHLYGEITALCNQKGYCWATNSYFAKLYDVSETSISSWVNQLKKAGHIDSIVTKDINGTQRIIRICPENGLVGFNKNEIPSQENLQQGYKKTYSPSQENLQSNNTVNNTSNKTLEEIQPPPIGGVPSPEKKLEESVLVLTPEQGKEYLQVFKLIQSLERVKKLSKQLTVDEFKKLLEAKYTTEQISESLTAMENSKSLKSKISTYLTLLNFLKGENGTPEEMQHYEKFIERYTEFIKLITGGEITAPRIDRYEKRAMYAIMDYLLKNSKIHTYDGAFISWSTILESWRKLDNYHQTRTKLTNINDDLIKIITAIKNANNKQSNPTNQNNAGGAKTGERKDY